MKLSSAAVRRAIALWLFTLMAATTIPATHARAEEKPQEVARAAYGRGVEAFSAQNYQLAHEQFTLAEKAFPSPNIELMLGRTLAKLGRLLEARAVLQKAQAGGTTPKYAATAATAGTEIASIEKQLAHVVLDIDSAHGDETLQINGSPVDPVTWSEPIAVDPGSVRLELSRPGVTPSVRQLILAAGATERVTLRLVEPPPLAAAATKPKAKAKVTVAEPKVPERALTATEEPPPAAESGRSPWLRGMSYALAGLGVAGIAGFVGFGAYSHGHYAKLEELCPPNRPCEPAYSWLADKGRTYQTLANVSLVAGGVALTAGVSLFILSLSPGRAEVAVTTSGIRLKGKF